MRSTNARRLLFERGPGFFVDFVAVAVFFDGLDEVEHDAGFAFAAEEQGGGDDVPRLDGDYVGGEEVKLGEGVVLLFEVVGLSGQECPLHTGHARCK